jgi:hypothetical protein
MAQNFQENFVTSEKAVLRLLSGIEAQLGY